MRRYSLVLALWAALFLSIGMLPAAAACAWLALIART